jgi:hypothetical protein
MPENDDHRAFALDRLGVVVRVGGYCYKAIYDAPYTQPFISAGQVKELTMRTTDVLECALADETVLEVDHEDGVTRDYKARVPRPDGTGWTVVPLEVA